MDGGEVRIRISAWVNRTENPSKVLKAIKNVVPVSEEDELPDQLGEGWPRLMVFETSGLDKLYKLRNSFRTNRILDTARMLLRSSLRGTSMELLVHKQAALSGSIVLCEGEEESPLGAIHIEILLPEHMEGNVTVFLDWLAPKTSEGRIVKEATQAEVIAALRGGAFTAQSS